MVAIELQELREYWEKKYPRLNIKLYSDDEGTRFYGMMRSRDFWAEIRAHSMGELISQGEDFLRKLNI
jgi:predicted RNA-binding protein (virulence factor B family)